MRPTVARTGTALDGQPKADQVRRRRSGAGPGERRGRARRSLLGLVIVILLVGGGGCTLGEDGSPDAAEMPSTAPGSGSIRVASPAAASPPTGPATRPAVRPAGPPVAPSPGTGTTAPFRSDAAEVGPVVWATSIDPNTKAPLQRVTAFPVDARAIYATLPVPRVAAGTTFGASWSYNGTPLDGFRSSLTAPEDRRDAWIEFHIELTGSEPLPDGTYAIEVTVNGQTAQTAAVAVGTPPAA